MHTNSKVLLLLFMFAFLFSFHVVDTADARSRSKSYSSKSSFSKPKRVRSSASTKKSYKSSSNSVSSKYKASSTNKVSTGKASYSTATSANTKKSYTSSSKSGGTSKVRTATARYGTTNSAGSFTSKSKAPSNLTTSKNKSTDFSRQSNRRATYFKSKKYVEPRYMRTMPSSFGLMDAMALSMILNSTNNARFAYNHQNDPDYLAWRQEMNAQAVHDPALSTQLATMDNEVATMVNDQIDPTYIPSDMPREVLYNIQPTANSTNEAPKDIQEVPHVEEESSSFFSYTNLFILVAIITVLCCYLNDRVSTPKFQIESALRAVKAFDLPLALRLNSKIKVSSTTTILHKDKLLATAPMGGYVVFGYEQIPIHDDNHKVVTVISNVFLENEHDANDLKMLQLDVSKDEKIEGCKWFDLFDEFTTASQEDWDSWLEEEYGLIGQPSASITKDNIEYNYDRATSWAKESNARITLEHEGKLTTTDEIEINDYIMMLYSRYVDDSQNVSEYCFMTSSAAVTKNEESSNDLDTLVSIYVGVDIHPTDIKVIY